MSGANETPRQKMIGMMYLFLTAMLAMNVSKEVLDSFVLVNDSLSTTVENFTQKSKGIYSDFDAQASMNEEKVGKWRDLAYEVKERADELNEYVRELKVDVVVEADGKGTEAITDDGDVIADKISSKDNQDVGMTVMDVKGKGPKLKKKIEEFREFLISNTDPGHKLIRRSIKKNLNTDDPPSQEGANVSWTAHQFGHMPLAAVITMLTKTQSDIRNAEADIVKHFYRQISARDFKFNDLNPVVLPTKGTYVLEGNEYKAEVFIAAQDTTQKPGIYVGDYEKTEDGSYRMVGRYDSLDIKNGRGVYKKRVRRRGKQEWGGLIAMRAPDGSIQQYPFDAEYRVERPTAIISASANRVFYAGVPNPLEISVPGLRKDQLEPKATNAKIRTHNGGLAVYPERKGGKVKVSLYGKMDGQQKLIGSNTFSVKQIPPPTASLTPINAKRGTIAKNRLKIANGLRAKLEGFIMENIKYEIVSYTAETIVGGFVEDADVQGNKFTTGVRSVIDKAENRISFINIKAKGPDGIKELSPIVLKIK